MADNRDVAGLVPGGGEKRAMRRDKGWGGYGRGVSQNLRLRGSTCGVGPEAARSGWVLFHCGRAEARGRTRDSGGEDLEERERSRRASRAEKPG